MSLYSVGNPPYGSPEFFSPLSSSGEAPSPGIGAYASFALGGDGVGNLWPSYAPSQSSALTQASPFAAGFGNEPSGGGTIWDAIGSLINGFGAVINNSIASIGNALGLGGSSSNAPATPPSLGDGASDSGISPQEQGFSAATFHSVGDPHDAFDGTNSSGSAVNGSWDDKRSHADLIHSDSFEGGVRVSTVTTPPIDSKGTRYNESATITSHDGRTQVTYNKDGSFYVSRDGKNVPLTPGATTSLGNGESVTLGADGSLDVKFDNGNGGTLAVKLSQSDGGKGVNVEGTSNNVDLGGYLVAHGENPGGVAANPPNVAPPQDPGFAPSPSTTRHTFAPTLPPTWDDPIFTPESPIHTDAPTIGGFVLGTEPAPIPVSAVLNLPPTVPAAPASTTAPATANANGAQDPVAKFAWLEHIYQ